MIDDAGGGRAGLPGGLGDLFGAAVDSASRVPPPAWWAAALALVLALLAARGPGRSERANPPMPAEYATLAEQLAPSLSIEPAPAAPKSSVGELLAETSRASVLLKSLRSDDPEIRALADEAGRAADAAARHLERLESLPRPPGAGEAFVAGFLRGFVFDFSGAARYYEGVQGRQEALVAEVKQLLLAARRAEAVALLLPRIAARHGGPRAPGGPPLVVDLDAAWGPFGPGDRLALNNRSGRALHRCTALVEVGDGRGATARSVHFAREWPAGATLYAHCSRGEEALGEVVGRQTVPDAATVAVSIWSDELSAEGIAYAYAGPERDADVAHYCRGMEVLASYRPSSKGFFTSTGRGVVLRLKGIAHLPNPKVMVTFRRRDEELAWSWDFTRWDEGEAKSLHAGAGLPWDPESFRVVVGFPATAHRYEGTWRVE